MSSTAEWAKFAPSLEHLLPAIEKRAAVLAGYSSGPQPQATDYDPEEPEHLSLLVDDPWQDETDQWIFITADGCYWFDCDGRHACSQAAFFAYLDQLPRRLHTFGRYIG